MSERSQSQWTVKEDWQTKGYSKYGASMGRDSYGKLSGEVTIKRVPIDTQGYDPGGAYWGTPSNLWCATCDDGMQYFRAESREDAQAEVRERAVSEVSFSKENPEHELSAFQNAYIEAALWSSTDDNGDPLDSNYHSGDLAEETITKVKADCEKFLTENFADLMSKDIEQGAHDFWLTRNGHGCGFWDGDWPKPQATRLTEASKKIGQVDWYVGDDGKIYQS